MGYGRLEQKKSSPFFVSRARLYLGDASPDFPFLRHAKRPIGNDQDTSMNSIFRKEIAQKPWRGLDTPVQNGAYLNLLACFLSH
jgi:hypothetical protein